MGENVLYSAADFDFRGNIWEDAMEDRNSSVGVSVHEFIGLGDNRCFSKMTDQPTHAIGHFPNRRQHNGTETAIPPSSAHSPTYQSVDACPLCPNSVKPDHPVCVGWGGEGSQG